MRERESGLLGDIALAFVRVTRVSVLGGKEWILNGLHELCLTSRHDSDL